MELADRIRCYGRRYGLIHGEGHDFRVISEAWLNDERAVYFTAAIADGPLAFDPTIYILTWDALEDHPSAPISVQETDLSLDEVDMAIAYYAGI